MNIHIQRTTNAIQSQALGCVSGDVGELCHTLGPVATKSTENRVALPVKHVMIAGQGYLGRIESEATG
jgi:hypothetical protein